MENDARKSLALSVAFAWVAFVIATVIISLPGCATQASGYYRADPLCEDLWVAGEDVNVECE
jgi:hypothetical protein